MARAVVVTWIGLAFLTVALWPGGARAQTTDSPNVAAPLAPEPAAAPMEIGLASLQLVVGYVAEIGGGYALAEMGVNHNDLGYHSEYTTLALATALLPALAGGAVGGLGYTSRHYRGRWWATFAGAYAGGIAGVLLGMAMAPKPGPDDTESFVRSMTGLDCESPPATSPTSRSRKAATARARSAPSPRCAVSTPPNPWKRSSPRQKNWRPTAYASW